MSKLDRDRKLIRARARIQSAQNGGRKRLEGPRYSGNGKLKPPTPNPVVVEHRRKLLGRPEAKGQALRHAENALDLMYSRGWLTKPLHETAGAFRRLYLASFPRLPDLKTTTVEEAPHPDTPIDRISRAVAAPNPDGNPAAMAQLRAIWRVLAVRPHARSELIEVCLLAGSWPTWLIAMIDARTLTADEKADRRAFFEGLHIVGQVLARPSLAVLAA